MIVFNNWKITHTGDLLARQYDNLSRTLLVKGVPEGYDWKMMVQVGGNFDILTLAPMEDGVGIVLTKDQLSISGYYTMQLVGTLQADGVTVRHTDLLRAFVSPSLSGDANWPTVPSEFTQLEQSAWAAANKAQEIANQIVGDEAWIYSEIGDDGCLYLVQGDAFGGAYFNITENGEMEVIYE